MITRVHELERPCGATVDQRVARQRHAAWTACGFRNGNHHCTKPAHHPCDAHEHVCDCGYRWPAIRGGPAYYA